METPQPKQAPVRSQQLHQREGTKQWRLLSQSKLLSDYSNFIKEKVLRNKKKGYWKKLQELMESLTSASKLMHFAGSRHNTLHLTEPITLDRDGCVYLEDMVELQITAPDCSPKESFSVKERSGRYIAVARVTKSWNNQSTIHPKKSRLCH